MPKLLKKSLLVRGDSLYCPLAFSLDTYSNCSADCVTCHFRRLNRIWDRDLRLIDFPLFVKTLENGLKNQNPKSPLAWAIHQRKTLRFGNKADPFQTIELTHRCSKQALEVLADHGWSVVIETKFTHILMQYFDLLLKLKPNLWVMPIISPGWTEDWEVLEHKATTPPFTRLKHLGVLQRAGGINVGVNGEPFIAGYHTLEQFETMIRRLRDLGIPSYNVYNLHLNEFIVKRLNEIGIDIEKVWYYNQDPQWRPILSQLIEIAKKYGIILGCPDFINSGDYREPCNTCCGLTVDNPCTFNLLTWKRLIQKGIVSKQTILRTTWDGVGDWKEGEHLMFDHDKDRYTMGDISWKQKM